MSNDSEDLNFYFDAKKNLISYEDKHIYNIEEKKRKYSPSQKFFNKQISIRFIRLLHFHGHRIHRRLHRTFNRNNERCSTFIKRFFRILHFNHRPHNQQKIRNKKNVIRLSSS